LKNTNSNTFCALPWMHIATSPGGTFRVCCNSDNRNNKILKEDGTPFKIYKDSVEDVKNSPTYALIKEQMLNGIQPPTCKRCFKQEEAGFESSRQVYNHVWESRVKLNENTETLYLDLRLGNQCNLKCRMCNPYSSNQWVNEWEELYGKFPEKERVWLTDMGWQKSDKINNNLFELAKTVEEIYLTGGEPTLIKEQDLLLDYCIENDLAKNISLKYNTNLTHVPKSLIDKWIKFKGVLLNCSIDAYGDLNTYIRNPIKWSKISRNFEKVKRIPNVKLDVCITVQIYNALHINVLLDWIMQQDLPNTMIFFNILEEPDQLNIKSLPPKLKQLAAKRLEPYFHLPKLSNVVDYMMIEQRNDWSKFVEFTKKVDSMRKENIFSVVPEFKDYFND